MTQRLDRETLASCRTRRYLDYPVELPDGRCCMARIQSLTELERARLAVEGDGDPAHMLARVIARCLVDQDDNRIFVDDDDALQFVESVDSAVTGQLEQAIFAHVNGRSRNAGEPDRVEQLAKN